MPEDETIMHIETNTPLEGQPEIASVQQVEPGMLVTFKQPEQPEAWSWSKFNIGNEKLGVYTAVGISFLSVLSAFLAENSETLKSIVNPEYITMFGAFLSASLVILKGLNQIFNKKI